MPSTAPALDARPGPSAPVAPPRARRVLVIDDSPTILALCEGALSAAGLAVDEAETAAEGLAALERANPAVVLLDLGLPDLDGLELLRRIREREAPPNVVIISSNASLNRAVEAMRLGAFDYVVKPFAAERIATTVGNAARALALSEEVESYRAQAAAPGLGRLIGSSPQMQAVYAVIRGAATSRATVFVTGESGTGKELCAGAIHALSPRAAAPFVAINCAAIPRDLMESEIFGHLKGAFTGASADREGAARRADGGTMFLDEICEMDLELQAKFLRLIQSGEVAPVGGGAPATVDIRFVCATNRDPWAEVRAGRFREDLLYRLHVIPLQLPPLRERGEDVLQIARVCLERIARDEGKRFAGFSPEAEAALMARSWPGNARELENAIHRAVALHDGEVLEARMLDAGGPFADAAAPPPPPAVQAAPAPAPGPAAAPRSPSEIRPLAELEREAIEAALAACGGNVPLAAAHLQVGVSTLYRKRAEWARDGL